MDKADNILDFYYPEKKKTEIPKDTGTTIAYVIVCAIFCAICFVICAII
jgi:hypothetical protein